jgi:hypothetical protein
VCVCVCVCVCVYALTHAHTPIYSLTAVLLDESDSAFLETLTMSGDVFVMTTGCWGEGLLASKDAVKYITVQGQSTPSTKNYEAQNSNSAKAERLRHKSTRLLASWICLSTICRL